MSNDARISSDGTAALASVRDVDFAYSQRLVLKHINMEVATGMTVGLVGPNGGGKTTLMRLLTGLLRPTRGSISLAGMDAQEACRAGNVIGYLPQKCEVNTRMPLSSRQLLRLCCDGSPHHDRIDWLLESVGLADLANEPMSALSGGQFQRLLIARALVRSPAVLLLDEPTTGIDAASREQFVTLLRDLRSRLKLTLIMSSHDLHTVHELCDDIACINVTLHLHRRPLRESETAEHICSLVPPRQIPPDASGKPGERGY